MDLEKYGKATLSEQLEMLQKAMPRLPKLPKETKGDPSKGGKLVKKDVMDKRGHKVAKWVQSGSNTEKKQKGDQSEEIPLEQREKQVSMVRWKQSAKGLNDKDLASAFSKTKDQRVKIILAHERTRRNHIDKNQYISFSNLPPILYNKCLSHLSSAYTKTVLSGAAAAYQTEPIWREQGLYKESEKDQIDKAFEDETSQLSANTILWKALDPLVHAPLVRDFFTAKIGSKIIVKKPLVAHGEISDNYVNDAIQDKQIRLKIYGLKGDKAMLFDKKKKAFLLPNNAELYVLDRNENTLSIKIQK